MMVRSKNKNRKKLKIKTKKKKGGAKNKAVSSAAAKIQEQLRK